MDKTYKNFKIPKRTGGYRNIEMPNEELMNKQRTILDGFGYGTMEHYLEQIALAYRHHRSTLDGVMRIFVAGKYSRLDEYYVLKMDIKNFFNSITREKFKEMIPTIAFINENTQNDFLEYGFCDCHNHLPQGSPLSGFISNLYMNEFDGKLEQLASGYYRTVRYADDIYVLAFSMKQAVFLKHSVIDLIEKYKLEPNVKKTRIYKVTDTNYANILGIRVYRDRIVVPRRMKKRLRALIHQGKTFEANGLQAYIDSVDKKYKEYYGRAIKKKLQNR